MMTLLVEGQVELGFSEVVEAVAVAGTLLMMLMSSMICAADAGFCWTKSKSMKKVARRS